eukprot:TRINITY_DN7654_c0_g1_i2.p1 TRINITY_DN7654_c0_g1~~TRINITY_DN7654_c0_g1_i2.p1  ORF type:complete len:601 (-),score=141.23 TRINITY_DN7654_c0_g1_i2:202-2004(-)
MAAGALSPPPAVQAEPEKPSSDGPSPQVEVCNGHPDEEEDTANVPEVPASSTICWKPGEAGAGRTPGGAGVSPLREQTSEDAATGLVSYCAELNSPMLGPSLRSETVMQVHAEAQDNVLMPVTLTLYCNGIVVTPVKSAGDEVTEQVESSSIAFSPFALVQACRMHSIEADQKVQWLRIFKISIYQHGSVLFFAVSGEDADAKRACWVADIARVLRVLTQSLFPDFTLQVEPLSEVEATATRLLAGYLLLFSEDGVSLVFAELHSHGQSGEAQFNLYEESNCLKRCLQIVLTMTTCVSERVGVDCSSFYFEGCHFTSRTCSEKMLWLRALSNVKVKLRHSAPVPTPEELTSYRLAIMDQVKQACERAQPALGFTRTPLLPRILGRVTKADKIGMSPGAIQSGPFGPSVGRSAPLGPDIGGQSMGPIAAFRPGVHNFSSFGDKIASPEPPLEPNMGALWELELDTIKQSAPLVGEPVLPSKQKERKSSTPPTRAAGPKATASKRHPSRPKPKDMPPEPPPLQPKAKALPAQVQAPSAGSPPTSPLSSAAPPPTAKPVGADKPAGAAKPEAKQRQASVPVSKAQLSKSSAKREASTKKGKAE